MLSQSEHEGLAEKINGVEQLFAWLYIELQHKGYEANSEVVTNMANVVNSIYKCKESLHEVIKNEIPNNKTAATLYIKG